MKLEKFSKNKKQKRIIISTIVGFIVLIGGITLYRTFALYEEKKEFNVLRGKVPDFSNIDIKLAFTINGEKVSNQKFPNKGEGYGVDSVVCNNDVTAEWDNRLWGLFNINNPTESNTRIECTINFNNGEILADVVSVGDYIEYTPSKTNYTISRTLSGYSIEQTINPSELNLWRVIRKNENGTVEAVSEYVSSTDIFFYGKTGYESFVNSLNTIAKQYETEEITVGSRHMGYSGQSNVTINSSITTAPWNTTTTSTNSPIGSDREKAGGGDYGFTVDQNLVQTALGTTIGNRPNTTNAASYWLASRMYDYYSDALWYYSLRRILIDGSEDPGQWVYRRNIANPNDNLDNQSKYNAIRPIVVFRSGLIVVEGNSQNNKKTWIVN